MTIWCIAVADEERANDANRGWALEYVIEMLRCICVMWMRGTLGYGFIVMDLGRVALDAESL